MSELSFFILSHVGAAATGIGVGWLLRRMFEAPPAPDLAAELRRQRDALQQAQVALRGRVEQLSVEAAAVPTLREELAAAEARAKRVEGVEAELASARGEITELRGNLRAIEAALESTPDPDRLAEVEESLRRARLTIQARDGEIELLQERLRLLREGWDAREAQWQREQAAQKPQPPPVIDDLTLIHGVGPELEARLNRLGIYTYADVAGWAEPAIDVDSGEPLIRAAWRDQARKLHAALYGA